MKTFFSFLFSIVLISASLYSQHIPPSHDIQHGSASACWGYANARAFGKSWNSPDCPARSIDSNEVPSRFFDRITPFDLSNIQIGDIIEFGNGNHVAYVSAIYQRTVTGIRVDQVDHLGAPEMKGLPLQTVIEGGTGIQRHEYPTGYYRKKAIWEAKIQNSFNGGTVEIFGVVEASPKDVTNLHWNTSVAVDAVENGQLRDGFIQRFQRWEDDAGNIISTSQNTNLPITHDDEVLKVFTAVFLREYNVSFQNNFINVGNTGGIKINGDLYSLPTDSFPVLETNSITGEAINQTINGISYTFDYWSDIGNNTYSNRIETFTPTGHQEYTAHFTGKPIQVQNIHDVGAVGEPIQLVWDAHPNSNCTYQVWRKVKDKQTGVITGPELLATLPHGTTSYTDPFYAKANTYIRYLLYYDVRAIYSVEQTTADPWWYTVYGQVFFKPGSSETPDTTLISNSPVWKIWNYPNPFNPATTVYLQVPQHTDVKVVIYNSRGQRIKTLHDGPLSSGEHFFQWNSISEDGRPVASGIYWLRLESKRFTATRKLLLVR